MDDGLILGLMLVRLLSVNSYKAKISLVSGTSKKPTQP